MSTVLTLLANRVRTQVATFGLTFHSNSGITSGANTSWSGHSVFSNVNSPWVNLSSNNATFKGYIFNC